ncbi:hypothetical protein RI367_005022 [Sorochytrium milnesiophthora]
MSNDSKAHHPYHGGHTASGLPMMQVEEAGAAEVSLSGSQTLPTYPHSSMRPGGVSGSSNDGVSVAKKRETFAVVLTALVWSIVGVCITAVRLHERAEVFHCLKEVEPLFNPGGDFYKCFGVSVAVWRRILGAQFSAQAVYILTMLALLGGVVVLQRAHPAQCRVWTRFVALIWTVSTCVWVYMLGGLGTFDATLLAFLLYLLLVVLAMWRYATALQPDKHIPFIARNLRVGV